MYVLDEHKPLDMGLHPDEIHVWSASLDQPRSGVQRLSQTLSLGERKRAERFHFEKKWKDFVVSHGILRTIMGRYLNVEANKLQFCYGKYGKPALTNTFGEGKICFSLSHSEGFVLYAFTGWGEIGVDIERIRDIVEMDQIAERVFSQRELHIYRALPMAKKKEAFFNSWTRKEAILKAIGTGISLRLDKFDVSFSPGEAIKALRIAEHSKELSQWSIKELKPAPGFAAALAVQGGKRRLRYYQWSN